MSNKGAGGPVEAYREALKEYTRERVPLDWAATQNNLGTALLALGERESGTATLKQAVEAYGEALKEYTRERVPLDWAMTQNNLGNALATLGERESGTATLKRAVQAYSEALKERTRERGSARLGGDAEQSRQCASSARGTGERDGDAQKGDRSLWRRAEGMDAGSGALLAQHRAAKSRSCECVTGAAARQQMMFAKLKQTAWNTMTDVHADEARNTKMLWP